MKMVQTLPIYRPARGRYTDEEALSSRHGGGGNRTDMRGYRPGVSPSGGPEHHDPSGHRLGRRAECRGPAARRPPAPRGGGRPPAPPCDLPRYPGMDVATGCTNFGNADEQEWYLPSQDQVSGGVLHLVAQPIPTRGTNSAGAAKTYECRSGMVTTMPGFSFEYGVVQVVAQIPSTAGLWPALWLLATDEVWP